MAIKINRSSLKRLLPPSIKRTLVSVRNLMNGPSIEESVLNNYQFSADPNDTPRINLVIPSLSSKEAFGGVLTGLNFFSDLVSRLKPIGYDTRIVTEQSLDSDDRFYERYSHLKGVETVSIETNRNILPTRSKDIFLVYNWWISLNIEDVLNQQSEYFNQPVLPKLYIIQDYEPQFYAFSAAHLLAREAVNERGPLWAIFNTNELFNYWKLQGHHAQKSFVFEPRMNGAIRKHADNVQESEKKRYVLVYGRPNIPRNAFFLIRKGLEIWAENYGKDHTDWEFISVGMEHEPVSLGPSHNLNSLGKLTLQQYAKLLRESAIGLSLMSSPHPSYPPLEMAHFGIRVITNSYTEKSPSSRHDNLITLSSILPASISDEIEHQIRSFEIDKSIGLKATSHMHEYLEDDTFECIDQIADELHHAFN